MYDFTRKPAPKNFVTMTGANTGYYIVTDADDKPSHKILADAGWGILPVETRYGFYFHYNVKPTQLIWTHPRFAGVQTYEKQYNELVEKIHGTAQ
jgi:hypothetical protein